MNAKYGVLGSVEARDAAKKQEKRFTFWLDERSVRRQYFPVVEGLGATHEDKAYRGAPPP